MEDKIELLLSRLSIKSLEKGYFLQLYSKFKQGIKSRIFIYDKGITDKNSIKSQIVYPTASAPKDILEKLPVVDYENLSIKHKLAAKNAILWVKKMNAGLGSSIQRVSHISKYLKVNPEEVHLGAKGTDLYVTISGRSISLGRLQIKQLEKMALDKKFKKIIMHDLAGPETISAINKLWKEIDLEEGQKLVHWGETLQNKMPTYHLQSENFSDKRIAPAGHAFFAFDSILASLDKSRLPPNSYGNNLIAVINNGEDLSSPDELMVGWMVDLKIPMALVTTTKTGNDMKGGQIVLMKGPNKDGGIVYTSIVERAQAIAADQLELFEQLGLREGDSRSYFNTNMLLINYDVLIPMVQEIIDDIGEDKFKDIIAPDLILNKKIEGGDEFIQLEGALASSVLNFDRYYREKYSRPLVYFLNVGVKNRTKFFSPIKSAFDFFMQFYSDRFKIDEKLFRLVNLREELLPKVYLQDQYYKDVENTLGAFFQCKIIYLDSLTILGVVLLNNFTLKGRVEIDNRSGKIIDLRSFNLFSKNDYTITDTKIEINKEGRLSSFKSL